MLEFHRDAGIVNSYLSNSRSIGDRDLAWLGLRQHDAQEAVVVNRLNLFCADRKRQFQGQDEFAEVYFHLVKGAAFVRILPGAPDHQFSTV
jgi:hypothetical protein